MPNLSRMSFRTGLVIMLLAIAATAGPVLAVQPPTAGLVAWYPFDGNANDGSGNNHNGTAYNGAAPGTDRFGNPNGAYSFNGSNSYIGISDNSAFDFAGKPFSIAAWIYLTGPFNGSAAFGSIFDRMQAGGSQGYRLDYSPTSNTFRLLGSTTLTVPAALTYGVWYHVVAVSDGAGNGGIYLDGAQIGTGSYATTAYAANPRIGDCQITGQAPFGGLFDDVRIYDRALTPEEVIVLYGACSFLDDYGRSQLCVDIATGGWQYSVLKGNGAGNIYTGQGSVMLGNGYMRMTALAGSGYGLSLIYYTTVHRATATFSYRPDAVGSALYDLNTLDDQTSCGAEAAPPID